MADKNLDFLRFSAYSIKDLITRKLSEDSKFTDQVYEGSNIAVLIDIVSYMYQCLIYQINNAASETMFSDTRIYENISRLCKFIGYTPRGYQASTMEFTIDNSNVYDELTGKSIKKYSYIDTNISDSEGNKIIYSTADGMATIPNSASPTILMQNGRWVKYGTVFSAEGVENETFILDDLTSDSSEDTIAAWPYVRAIVERNGKYVEFNTVTDNFLVNNTTPTTSLYNSNSLNCELSLTGTKHIQIKFGDGVTSAKLEKNDIVHVIYLKPNINIQLGEVEASSVQGNLRDGVSYLFGSQVAIWSSFGSDNVYNESQFVYPTVTNTSQSYPGTREDDVSTIKQNAPKHYIIANRLITEADYEAYIKQTYADNVIDVKAQNNYDYITTFYKWLYALGVQYHSNPSYYLNEYKLSKYDYKFSDAADANNVYLWIKMKNQSRIYSEVINTQVSKLKQLTTDVSFIEPITVSYGVCASDLETARKRLVDGSDVEENSYLEVVLDNANTHSAASIKEQIMNKIVVFFNELNFGFGSPVNLSELETSIYSINGVSQLRTVFKSEDVLITKPGLSFAKWTSTIVDSGEDVQIMSGNHQLELFQLPTLHSRDFEIKIITNSASTFSNDLQVRI